MAVYRGFIGRILIYFRKNWIIYTLLMAYTLLLIFRAMGLNAWLPGCLISFFTGHECFGCGLNTAAVLLIKLEFTRAFHANPLIYPYVLLIIGWITYDFYKFNRQQKQQNKDEQD